MNYGPLNRELARVTTPVFPTSFREIREQATEKFGRGWKSDLARESGLGLRQIERWDKYVRGETGQTRNPDAARGATREKLIGFGKTLDPVRKDVSGAVTLEIRFREPGDKAHNHNPRTRTAKIEMSAAELFDFVNTPGQPEYADLFDLWFQDGGDQYGEDGDYEADIVDVYAT